MFTFVTSLTDLYPTATTELETGSRRSNDDSIHTIHSVTFTRQRCDLDCGDHAWAQQELSSESGSKLPQTKTPPGQNAPWTI